MMVQRHVLPLSFSFSLFYRAKETDNMLSMDVRWTRIGRTVYVSLISWEYIHVKGCVKWTQPFRKSHVKLQRTCPFGNMINC